MSRSAWVVVFGYGWAAAAAAADPPPGMTGGTAAVATAKGLAPGGRGPARPRGEATALPLAPKGKPAVVPVLPPFAGGPALAPQPPIDIALFGKTRPVHIRIETRADGQSLAAAWDEHLRTLFAAFDRNGDGFLNRYEFDFVFSPAGVVKLLQGKAYVPYQDGDAGPDFDAADRDRDGRISFEEFRAYYTEPVRAVVSLEPQEGNGEDTRLSLGLLELLDRNKTGRITAEDCKDVRDLIKKYDKNEDECLSLDEIPPARPMMAKIGRISNGPGSTPSLVAAAGPLPDAFADHFLRHYDRNKDGVLTAGELPPDLFARLDANGDGKLTRDKILAWRTGEPDLVVVISTGLKPEHCTVAVTSANGKVLPTWATCTSVSAGHAVLRADGRVLEFTAPVGANNHVPLDGDGDLDWPKAPNGHKNSTVRESELFNQNQVFRVLFDHMDFDGNGVVTYAEYQKYMTLQRSTAGFPLTVSYRTQPVDLFKLLDENGDGRLSARELRQAYEKLRPLDPSAEPVVTAAALKPTATFRVARPSGVESKGVVPQPPGTSPSPPDETAPLWFRKMDANNDGEVSKKEFLGTAEQFKMLDTNGDGVISIEEAKAYEAKRKK